MRKMIMSRKRFIPAEAAMCAPSLMQDPVDF